MTLEVGVQLVWDNDNFLVIAFGPTTRPSQVVLSLAAQRSGVALCLQHGGGLADPQQLLRGSGVRVRTLRLEAPDDLDRLRYGRSWTRLPQLRPCR
ncbi:hypothetical protein [uncultured Friedmanniella sp.]|uniref:hypothetical protein n=1 Tax=uncultured Friedmanniella sp. TaxID=335381 RepID=UPI0035CC8D8B